MAEPILLGQGRPLELLHARARAQTLPHALLVCGASGSGKSTLLSALAQALLCPAPRERPACGTCSTCRRVASGQHPDLHRLEPLEEKKEISSDSIRDVLAALQLRSFEGGARVLVVDPADTLNETGQNILLKTLEEPWPDTWVLLASSRPDALLPTVRSRCATLRLRPVAEPELRALLRAEGADPAALEFAVRHAGGAVGVARELLDPFWVPLAARIANWAAGGDEDPIDLAAALLAGASEQRDKARQEKARRVRYSFVILRACLRAQLRTALAEPSAATYSAASIERWVASIEQLFAAEADLAVHIPVEQTLTAVLLRGAG